MTTIEVEDQRILVGGEWVDAADGRTFETLGGYTRAPTGPIAAASPDDARRAADAAHAAFPGWAATPPAERRALLLRAADLLEQRTAAIAATACEETGATLGWGAFNVHLATGMIREAAAQAYGLIGEVIPSDVPGLQASGVRRPVGVVLGIAPWNAPVILATRAVASPLAYGNTVVLKASEESPRTHAAVAAALDDAGVPDGVVNFVTNAPEDASAVVGALIDHPAVRRINFTGSTAVGRIIAARAAEQLKRVLLELGGKAPLVVLADADLDRAVAAATFGAFMNSGQICMSTERIVVERPLADAFAEALAARADALVVGNPAEPGTEIGALVNQRAIERMTELVEDARAKGAQVLAGGAADGPCFAPTVLYGVSPEMRVYGEESFGPLAPIVVAEDPEDAIRIANDTRYGLAAAVFSRDVPTALAVARRLETGICHVNGATVHDEPQMPFGGVKDSGWGRFGGRAALDEFTELRWLTVSEGERQYPI